MAVTLTVGTNSYVSVADAQAYFDERLYVDAWTSASDDDKARALIMATRAIDRQIIKGKRKDTTQALQWPRCYTPTIVQAIMLYHSSSAPPETQIYDGPLDQDRTFIPALATFVCDATVPQAVINATCEEAIARLERGNSDRRALQLDGVTQVQIGNVRETYATGVSGRSAIPKGLLSIEAREWLAPYLGGAVPIR